MARRTRRGRRTKLGDLGVILLIEIVTYALLHEQVWPPLLVLLDLSLLGFWWSFAMPTYCDHMTNAIAARCRSTASCVAADGTVARTTRCSRCSA